MFSCTSFPIQFVNDTSSIELQIGKAFKPKIFFFGGRDYDFDEWRGFSKIDGWLCRSDRDCEWMDRNLGCDDREFSINVVNVRKLIVIDNEMFLY